MQAGQFWRLAIGDSRQLSEGEGEVRLHGMHGLQQAVHQFGVALFSGGEAQLGAKARQPVVAYALRYRFQNRHGGRYRLLRVFGHQGQQGFRQPRQVPLENSRLLGIGVAALVVDGTEYCVRSEGLHERTGAVVDGFARQGHVVGVHDAVNEAQPQPLRHEGALPVCYGFQQGESAVVGLCQGGVMPLDGFLHQYLQGGEVASRREILEGTNAQVATRYSRHDAAGEG